MKTKDSNFTTSNKSNNKKMQNENNLRMFLHTKYIIVQASKNTFLKKVAQFFVF